MLGLRRATNGGLLLLVPKKTPVCFPYQTGCQSSHSLLFDLSLSSSDSQIILHKTSASTC